jgi:5-carboxymethyl-2-hydroxymuconate isomerase
MPQIILEHSANLVEIDYNNLFLAIYECIKKFPNMGTCKMRAISQNNYFIGTDNGENAFIFLRILMAPKAERTSLFREEMAKGLITIIKKYLNPIKKTLNIKCYPTLEIGLLSEQYYWINEKRL